MKKKLRYGLIAAIPIILCMVAVSIRVAVPPAGTVTIEGDIEARIAFAQSQLEHYTIRALDDGLVISLSYDEGGLAFAGTQMCQVSRENQKKFVFYLPQEYMDSVDYGSTITVTGRPASKGGDGIL